MRRKFFILLFFFIVSPTGFAEGPLFDLSTIQDEKSEHFSSSQPDGFHRAIFRDFTDSENQDFNHFLGFCGALSQSDFVSRSNPFRVFFQKKSPHLGDRFFCKPNESGALLAALEGKGFLHRLWMTTTQIGSQDPLLYQNERLKIWVDDKLVVHDLAKNLIQPGSTPQMIKNNGSYLSLEALSFSRSIRMFLDNLHPLKVYYYQTEIKMNADLLKYKKDRKDDQKTAKQIRENFNFKKNNPHQSFEYRDQGTLKRLVFKVATRDLEKLKNLSIEFQFDQNESLKSKIMFLDFFGQTHETKPLQTTFFQISEQEDEMWFESKIPMPFKNQFHLMMKYEGKETLFLQAEYTFEPSIPEKKWGYFYALTHTSLPDGKLAKHEVAHFQKMSGRYIGIWLHVLGLRAKTGIHYSSLSYLEGDDLFDVDGEVFHGTGTEDYFNGGWYFLDGLKMKPDFGVSVFDVQKSHSTLSVYRFLPSYHSMHFQDDFRLQFEIGAAKRNSFSHYQTTAFFYLLPHSP